MPTNNLVQSKTPKDVASPDQPLARLQIATLVPINIQREKRSANQPKIGAVNM
jgi:hypothetical protein